MDFWKPQARREDARDDAPEPSFLEKLTDYAKDEAKDAALSSAVEFLTDGWFTYEGGDEDDEEPQRKTKPEEDGTFEERLQRSLARLQEEAGVPAAATGAMAARPAYEAPPVAVPVPQPSAPASIAPAPAPAPLRAARPPLRGPGGFGRKGL
jgi:hypothetical protein